MFVGVRLTHGVPVTAIVPLIASLFVQATPPHGSGGRLTVGNEPEGTGLNKVKGSPGARFVLPILVTVSVAPAGIVMLCATSLSLVGAPARLIFINAVPPRLTPLVTVSVPIALVNPGATVPLAPTARPPRNVPLPSMV